MKGRNSALHYVYQILHAGADSARHSDLEVHTRLFRDGRQMYEGKPMPLETVSQRDPKGLVAAGAMKLSAQMQPGPLDPASAAFTVDGAPAQRSNHKLCIHCRRLQLREHTQ
jgi:hypothetical protein